MLWNIVVSHCALPLVQRCTLFCFQRSSMQAIAHGDANCATQKRERTEPSKRQAPTRASTESVQKMSGPDGVKGQLD